MKKLNLILAMTVVTYSLYAQTEQTDTQNRDSVFNEKNKPYPKCEVGFSGGIFPIVGIISPDGIFGADPGWHTYYIGNTREGNYEKMYCFGSYTFNFNYHFSSKNSLGVSLSWIGRYIDKYWIYALNYDIWRQMVTSADTVKGKGWKHHFPLQVNYRHTYYRKNKISLYFGISGGITFCIRDKNILPKETIQGFISRISNVRTYLSPAMQFSAFGLEIWEKYVCNLELGFGTLGLFKAGFKYK